jgi:hypothetical protein
MTLIDFKQPSTWRGLLSLLGLIGWTLTPELRDQIAIVIVGLLSLIEMFRDETLRKDPPPPPPEIRPVQENPPPAPAQSVRWLGTSHLPTRDPESTTPGFNHR